MFAAIYLPFKGRFVLPVFLVVGIAIIVTASWLASRKWGEEQWLAGVFAFVTLVIGSVTRQEQPLQPSHSVSSTALSGATPDRNTTTGDSSFSPWH